MAAELRLVVDNSRRWRHGLDHDPLGQEPNGQSYTSAQGELGHCQSIPMRHTVTLPFVDSFTVNLVPRRMSDRACHLGATSEGLDEFRMVVHGPTKIRRIFGFVNDDDSRDGRNKHEENSCMATKAEKSPLFLEVGARLRELREVVGYSSTRSFAAALDIPEDRLGTYERGIALLPMQTALALKRRFGVTTDWLYDEDPVGMPVGLYKSIETHRQHPKTG